MSLCDIAVGTRQAGLTKVTPQWLMGLFGAKCVSIGDIAVVTGQLISISAIVEVSTFTNSTEHQLVSYVTVATEYPLHQVGRHFCINLQQQSKDKIVY